MPPFQHIPGPVPKPRVSQRGAVIFIEWEAPTKTTDGSELRLGQVEVLRRIVEPPPPSPAVPEAAEPPATGIGETEEGAAPSTVSAGEPQASPAAAAGTTSPTPTTPSRDDPAQTETSPATPTAPAGELSETPAATSNPSQENGSETPVSSPGGSVGEEGEAGPTVGQTEGGAEGDGPLVMTPPPVLQVLQKPKGFGEEARIIAKLDVDPSGGPFYFEDEWKPRWKDKRLEYAVRYVNPKGLKGAHSRPTAIETTPPLPPPSELSVIAEDGFVRVSWTGPPGLAEWQEEAVSEEGGVTFELGFNVYRKAADGDYRSAAPMNRKLLVESVFEDRNVRFGKEWCYIVRGVAVPIPPEPTPVLTDEIEGAELAMPSDEQIDEAVSKVVDAPSQVVEGLGLGGAAGTNLQQAKQLPPPEPSALIESKSTDEVCLKPIDTFAPAAPSRLVTLETPDGIMISWSESDEGDLKGFLVYRAEKRRGPFELLTKEPIRLTSFTDSDVTPGETYFYAVSAVDSAEPPNESERSSLSAATAPE